jgi:hypothetical protein
VDCKVFQGSGTTASALQHIRAASYVPAPAEGWCSIDSCSGAFSCSGPFSGSGVYSGRAGSSCCFGRMSARPGLHWQPGPQPACSLVSLALTIWSPTREADLAGSGTATEPQLKLEGVGTLAQYAKRSAGTTEWICTAPARAKRQMSRREGQTRRRTWRWPCTNMAVSSSPHSATDQIRRIPKMPPGASSAGALASAWRDWEGSSRRDTGGTGRRLPKPPPCGRDISCVVEVPLVVGDYVGLG